MRLSLEALLILDALDRHGTFAAAAARLFKTASALSYTVQKMESDLNIKLLDRSGHRATFTPTGRLMLDKGRVLLRAVSWESKLTISLDASVPFALLTPLIDRFYAEHQHTQLLFRHDVLAGCWEALSYGEADILFGAVQEPLTRSGIEYRPIGWLEYVFAVAPHHPLASRHSTGADLRVLDEQKMISVHDFNAKVHAQIAGLGCGYLPRYLAAPHLESGALVERRLDTQTRRDQAFMAWNENATGNAAMWWRENLQDFEGINTVYSPE